MTHRTITVNIADDEEVKQLILRLDYLEGKMKEIETFSKSMINSNSINSLSIRDKGEELLRLVKEEK